MAKDIKVHEGSSSAGTVGGASEARKKYTPLFDQPKRPSKTHSRVISHDLLAGLGPEQARNTKVT